ncbi:MAG TPA: DUF2752 domain-containing protein [bacterium]|nr:DUF2752 domain-containing protein [bacterium]
MFNDPRLLTLYVQRPLHALTGLHCPGCGTMRALHALLHGKLVAALGCNPLMMLLMPLLLVKPIVNQWRNFILLGFLDTPAVYWTILIIVIVYTIFRNIPVETCVIPVL